VQAGASIEYRFSEVGGGCIAMADGHAIKYALADHSYQECSDDLINNLDAHAVASGTINNTVAAVTGCMLTGDHHSALVSSYEKNVSMSAEGALESFVMGKLGALLHSQYQTVLHSSGHRHPEPTDCAKKGCDRKKNQCIFLNLLIAQKRKFRRPKLKAAAKPKDLKPDRDMDDSSAVPSPSSSSDDVVLINEYGEHNSVSKNAQPRCLGLTAAVS
jgi:hypothetical protein